MDVSSGFRAYDQDRTISYQAKRLYKENSINYKKFYDGNTIEWLQDDKLEGAPKFNNEDLVKSLSRIARTIDSTQPTDLIMNPPLILQQFQKYLLQNIPSASFSVLVSTFPPSFPKNLASSESILKSIIKIIHISQNPAKSLSWFINCVFPTEWKSNVPDSLRAICNPKTFDRSVAWASLTSDKKLVISSSFNNSPFKIFVYVPAAKAKKIGPRLTFYGEDGSEICKFIPTNEKLIPFWVKSFDKKPVHFFTFLDDILFPVPPEVTNTLYKILTTKDMFYTRALFQPDLIGVLDRKDIFRSLLNISQHSGKIVLLINTFLSTVFSQPQSTIDHLCSSESLLHDFYFVYFEKFSYKFFLNFADKIVRYINEKSLPRVPNNEEGIKYVETVVFTCIKYIMDSGSFIPLEIRILAFFVKSFCDAKFNKQIGTFRILSDMFSTQLLCPFIANPALVFPNYVYQQKSFPVLISNILNCILTLSEVERMYPQYNRFDQRVLKNYMKKIFNFTIDLANTEIDDFKNEEEEKPEINLLNEQIEEDPKIKEQEEKEKKLMEEQNKLFGKADEKDVLASVETIMKWISSNNQQYMKSINDLRDKRKLSTSSAGWAIAAHVSKYFADVKTDMSQIDAPPTTVFSTSTATIQENEEEKSKSSTFSKTVSSVSGDFMTTDSEFTWTYDSRITHDAGDTVFDDDLEPETTFDALEIAIKLNMLDKETEEKLIAKRKKGIKSGEEESIESLQSIPTSVAPEEEEQKEKKVEEEETDEEEKVEEREIDIQENSPPQTKSISFDSTKVYSQTTFNTGYTGETLDEYSYSITATTDMTGEVEETIEQTDKHKRRHHSKQKNGTYTFTSTTNDQESESTMKSKKSHSPRTKTSSSVKERDLKEIPQEKDKKVENEEEKKKKHKIRRSKKKQMQQMAANKSRQFPIVESFTILAPDQNGVSKVIV